MHLRAGQTDMVSSIITKARRRLRGMMHTSSVYSNLISYVMQSWLQCLYRLHDCQPFPFRSRICPSCIMADDRPNNGPSQLQLQVLFQA